MPLNLVTRAQWGAPATSPAAALPKAKGTKIHWLGGEYHPGAHSTCDDYVRGIRNAHLANKDEDWVDIAYNYLVCPHGWAYEGRGARKRSGANGSQKLNTDHYAVCVLTGTKGHTVPTDEQLQTTRDVIDHLRKNGAGSEIKGHRDGLATECPGDWLYAWVRKGAPAPAKKPPVTPPKKEQHDVATMQHGSTEIAPVANLESGKWHRFRMLDVKGPYHYALDAFLTLDGVTPGAEVQARFVELNSKGQAVKTKRIAERHGTWGQTFVDFTRAAAHCDTGNTIALDLKVLNYDDPAASDKASPFKVIGGSAEFNYVPA